MPRTADVDSFFLNPVFLAFAMQRPVAVMAQVTLRHLLDDDALAEVFRENARTQREQVIPFAALAQMLANVVLSMESSVNSSIKQMQKKIAVSQQAIYGKLQRVETATSRGLVRYSFERVEAVGRELGFRPRGDVPGYETRILDGNHLAGTDHRLKETRNATAAPLPGKTLVVYSPRLDAVVDAFPIEDGVAQERSGLDAVLETVGSKELWVADRNFCTLKFLYGLAAKGAKFVVRQHGQLKGEPAGTPKRIGANDAGEVREEDFLLPSRAGETLEIRRVSVRLKTPTRDGQTEIFLLTNLAAEEADAMAVAEIYRRRWRIETMMQRLTVALACEIKTLCYPKAALFAFALAIVMYNALAIIRMSVDAAFGEKASASLSHYYMAAEIAKTTDGMLVVLPPEQWDLLASASAARLAAELRKIAGGMNLEFYAKNERGPKKPKPKAKHVRDKVHVSAKRILDARKK